LQASAAKKEIIRIIGKGTWAILCTWQKAKALKKVRNDDGYKFF